MRQEEAARVENLFSTEEWPNKHLRGAVISKLEDELARNPHFVLGTSRQVEDFIFQKSKNQDDYRRRVQKFINVINGAAGRQPSNQQQMGAAAAAASSAAALTTSLHTGQPLGYGPGTFGTANVAMVDVDMVSQEYQNGLPFNPYAAVQQQQTPAAAQAPPQHLQQQQQHHHQQYNQQQPQQQIPTAAQALPQKLLQQQQQFPMPNEGFGAPPQYNSFVHNPYQAQQQQAGTNAMHPQAVPSSNEEGLPANGTAEYQMMYQNKLHRLHPYLGRLRDKLRQYHAEGAADAAINVDIMINALEGRQKISWEDVLNMESWILSNAEFQPF